MRKGEEFLNWSVLEDPDDKGRRAAEPHDWHLVLDGNIDSGLDCEHQYIEPSEHRPDDREFDYRVTPRALEVRSSDPWERGTVCMDCLLVALRQLGMIPK